MHHSLQVFKLKINCFALWTNIDITYCGVRLGCRNEGTDTVCLCRTTAVVLLCKVAKKGYS